MNNSNNEHENTTHRATFTGTTVQKSLDIINKAYPPILIIVGVTCNIIIILVMRTKSFRSQPSAVFMTVGAINDALSLTVSMTTHWLYVSFDGIYYRNNVRSICKFLDFYGWGNCDFGIIMTSAMTVDRALAITFPFSKFTQSSSRRAKITIFILAVIVIAKEFHFLIGSNMVDESRKERLCDVFPNTKTYTTFWKEIWPWLHLSYLILCFLVIILSNIILFCQIRKSSKFEKSQTIEREHNNNTTHNKVTVNHNRRVEKKLHTITPMLIGESIVLLILTFPFSIQLSISHYNPSFYNAPEMTLLFSATFYMLYTNKCVTFFVYLVTGTRFRLALKDILTTCLQGKQKLRRNRFNAVSMWYRTKKRQKQNQRHLNFVNNSKSYTCSNEDVSPYSTSSQILSVETSYI